MVKRLAKKLLSYFTESSVQLPGDAEGDVDEGDAEGDVEGDAEGDVDDDQFRSNVNFIERLSVRKVNDAIANLSTGVGFDGVHSNHLKFSSPLMIFVFCTFFNSCLIHNYIPSSMLAGVINPIIKNKAGNVRDSRNFREIMISSNFFKVFEYILLPFIKQLPLSLSQFGYRSGSSTILATTLLKEAIDGYIIWWWYGIRVFSRHEQGVWVCWPWTITK